MSGVRYLPREMSLEVLVKTLSVEHETMREEMRLTREAMDKGDFDAASRSLSRLDSVFRQHIADEEGQILKLLVGRLGVQGAKQEIEVFQQHRPIYRLMQAVGELAQKKSVYTEPDRVRLDALFEEHTKAEEGWVYPRAMSLR